MAAVSVQSDFETKKIKSVTAFTFSSSIYHEADELHGRSEEFACLTTS